MINFLYKLFNHDKIDKLNNTRDMHMERIKQLELEVKEYKGYKLKYKVAKMYVNDDEGLLELFEIAEKAERFKHREPTLQQAAAQQQAAALNGIGIGFASAETLQVLSAFSRFR